MKQKLPVLGWVHSNSMHITICAIAGLSFQTSDVFAEDTDVTIKASPNNSIQEITVIGRSESMVGEAESASQGHVGAAELASRPYLRPAEVLEAVPGMVISQHSGPGKANQYYLRGFNLDHGTDFATSIEGMPINMPTHAHGQGYTDLNSLIPELIRYVDYRKGPYYADQGDFSAAGAANIQLMNELPQGIGKVTIGTDGYKRLLTADSVKIGNGNVLAAFEAEGYDGPFRDSENEKKLNGILRFSQGNDSNGFNITALGYHNSFDSTDQIPRRAITEGLIPRLGAIDDSDGGSTERYSLVGDWRRTNGNTADKLGAYIYYYDLKLFSNFTYFLDDPIHGDQFEQADRRIGVGGNGSHQWATQIANHDITNTIGFQVRNDYIPQVALFHTEDRQKLSTTSNNDVNQTSGSLYAQNEIEWLPKFRTTLGLRGDLYHFKVDSNIQQNSGEKTSGIVSPKFGAVLGPWKKTEFYFNAGEGFHSNDARGTTIKIDPADGVTPVSRATPLVKARGAEVGIRSAIIPNLNSTLAYWILDIDSELLFVGDAGATEAGRPSRRHGIEWSNFYKPLPWLTLDADLALSQAKFTNFDIAGGKIPGSIETVFSSGATVDFPSGIYGSLRWRYFGPRALIEDNTVRSSPTSLFNAIAGYHYRNMNFSLEALNLFNRKVDDIAYYYASRLAGEPADGVNDVHLHPAEPREIRASVTVHF